MMLIINSTSECGETVKSVLSQGNRFQTLAQYIISQLFIRT